MILGVHPSSSLANLTSLTSLLKTTLPVSTSGEVSPRRRGEPVRGRPSSSGLLVFWTRPPSWSLLEEQPSPRRTSLQPTG